MDFTALCRHVAALLETVTEPANIKLVWAYTRTVREAYAEQLAQFIPT